MEVKHFTNKTLTIFYYQRKKRQTDLQTDKNDEKIAQNNLRSTLPHLWSNENQGDI